MAESKEVIQVTLTCVLSDIWGAPEAYAVGGDKAVRELIQEDLSAFFEETQMRCERLYVTHVSADENK